MKWAIFQFDDHTCEIGQTSWILNEDEKKFTNDVWLPKTEIVVRWPKDFSKVARKLGKTPVDITDVSSILCTATIIKFSDVYETIKGHLQNYLKTGDTKTPNRGRGQRVPKKNSRYAFQSDSENDDTSSPKKNRHKKLKYTKPANDDNLLNLVQNKYGLGDESDREGSGDDDITKTNNLQELLDLRAENKKLREEVRDMRKVISNMRDLTDVNQALSELTKAVNLIRKPKTWSTSSSSSSSSRSSPSRTPSGSKPKMEPVYVQGCDEDNSSDELAESSNMILLCPGIQVLKAQKKILDTCGEAKVYTYTLMEMLWSREVMATHSMTGKSSNAHKDKVPKPCLDPIKVKALCDLVMRKYKLPDVQRVKNMIKGKLANVEKSEKLKKTISVQQ